MLDSVIPQTMIPQTMKTGASDESKFRIVLMIAMRAKQIQAGARPLIHKVAWKATRMAREEFGAGLIRYEILPTAVR